MYKGKSFLGIITARGGSKGLPGKNIRVMNGKKLIEWTVEAAKKSSYLDTVMVTTDSVQIGNVAKESGAEVPFMRPSELAGDTVSSFDTIKHTIDFYEDKLGKSYDYVVLLEPTSPLRESVDIDRAIEQLFENEEAESIVGVCKAEAAHPSFLAVKDEGGFLSGYMGRSVEAIRRQELDDVYFFEGTVYASETDVLKKKRSFYHDRTIGYVVPKWKSPEVDDIYDFIMIEAVMKYKGYK